MLCFDMCCKLMSKILIINGACILMLHDNLPYPHTVSVEIGDLSVNFIMTSVEWGPVSIVSSPLHMHTMHELQFILSGVLQIRVDEDDSFCVPGNSLLLIPPDVLHTNGDSDGKRIIATIALQPLHQEHTNRFSEFRYYCALFGGVQKPLVFQSSAISDCVEKIVQLPNLPQNEHRRKNLLAYLFIQLGLAIENTCEGAAERHLPQLGNQYNHQYYLIEHHININYNKKTSVEEIADILHMSRRQVDRIVHQIWGKTYAMLILERRMLIARKLLMKTDMPCTKVAEEVGYTSYPGFYLAFRRYFGNTPEEIRVLHRN